MTCIVSPLVVVNNNISIKVAAEFSDYNLHYPHRLLQDGKLTGLKIGQFWQIYKSAFDDYMKSTKLTKD